MSARRQPLKKPHVRRAAHMHTLAAGAPRGRGSRVRGPFRVKAWLAHIRSSKIWPLFLSNLRQGNNASCKRHLPLPGNQCA